jgi:hypothetical protein
MVLIVVQCSLAAFAFGLGQPCLGIIHGEADEPATNVEKNAVMVSVVSASNPSCNSLCSVFGDVPVMLLDAFAL